ncbi:MAG: alpha-1,4-glucan--maltose-1-phosphate maltosyltransferase [Candidatus Abyssobacteria bacterium SURF_5]|uniref:Alpha-1,4-glucan:maltose-1-phosphate maltosyltransferase n=1 Tax=Abyssobacteria bacterium (strain SURF_5) TaxID=2093360 RepID=A0A3A4NN25_ABYX5|nr:MAG: alpha-1,4-glucan--maltose-1-phosphate maltosyltransferase [Candidatus Abyssubacteria bacterium SURF_5]
MDEGRKRVVIERVRPEIDCGRFPIKRVVGEKVTVRADIFADGHDSLSAVLCHKKEGAPVWNETHMKYLVNDRWEGQFPVDEIGFYRYTIEAWVDRFKTWRADLAKKANAGTGTRVDLLIGADLLGEAAGRASGPDAERLQDLARALRTVPDDQTAFDLSFGDEPASLMAKYPDRRFATGYGKELVVFVDRTKAQFSAWYEMFPRSCSAEPGRHGTFADCEKRLPYIASMGFDVLYLPPIHPIGTTNRKGRNNRPDAGPDDPGSPWAIGSSEGGHMAVHPQLGTLEDFRRLVEKGKELGVETAIDLALQGTPDHPYVKDHPEWFRWRPDGTIQYAENPPKKYEDIYPFNFESDSWRKLWEEIRKIVFFWIEQGVTIFRVDNPHTKPFQFWEWLIAEVRSVRPDILFLSEAFTRPKVMYDLAKVGFSQSYTYFTWRNTKWELEQYFAELTQTEVSEFFRPNLWPNTPDILTEYLQMGGRPAFMIRFILAATLGASYGIYGPAFELCEDRAREFGSEEYFGSEKYEIRYWDIDRSDSLKHLIAMVNKLRRENPALQSGRNLRFHAISNEQLICYSKHTDDLSDIILAVVNLDAHHAHAGWLDIPLSLFGLDPHQSYQAHDLLSGARYLWYGSRNYVEIDPNVVPAHLFRIRRRIRTERDFDYFM